MNKAQKAIWKTVLVTGCAGYIGSRFVERFHAQFPKVRIIGVDNLSTGKKENIHDAVIFYKVSITDSKRLDHIFATEKPECVFHFAAMPRVAYCEEHPTETYMTNVIGTSTVFETAVRHGTHRVIFSSSAAVYGSSASFPAHEITSHPKPISCYGAQKYACEELARIMSAHHSTEIVCLRYFNVYGPGQDGTSSYATVIARWLDAVADNRAIVIEGDGTQTRDFVYIDDVVAANIAASVAQKNIGGVVCNIASGTETSLQDIKNKIEKVLGVTMSVQHKPARQGDIVRSVADIKLAQRLLKWKPKVSFDKGIKATVLWYTSR